MDLFLIYLGTNSKSVHILHAKINDIQRSGEVSTTNLQLVTSFNDAHSGSVYTMDYSPDTGALVTGSNDKSIRILK
jgi:WD40 repeat protein